MSNINEDTETVDTSVDDSTIDTTEASDDIGTVDETTTATSGGEETTGSETTSESTTEDATPTENVPYSRFKEVIEERNALRQKVGQGQETQTPQPSAANPQLETVKQQLKELGFVTKEEQEAELRRQQEDIRVESQLNNLAEKYNGKDGRPKFDREKVLEYAINHQIADVEAAYKQLNEAKIIDWHVKQALAGKKSVKTESSDGSGSAQSGVSDEDLKSEVSKGNKSALSAYLKRRIRAAQK